MNRQQKFMYHAAIVAPTISLVMGDMNNYLYATIGFAWVLAGAFLFKSE